MELKNQHVVVVGGSSGIGLASAKLAVTRGAKVTIVGRDSGRLKTAAASIGSDVKGETADASDRAALDALFARIAPIHHLVLAASGGAGAGPFEGVLESDLRRGFEAKFWVHWNAAQSSLAHIHNSGSLLFLTAASSRFANQGTSGLAAINGALDRMVITLARELAPLRVNAVSPGVINTPWWADKPASMFDIASQRAPLKRAGDPEEVAEGVVFLLINRFITGVVLEIDGGLHLT